jgi:hypothetical protein
MDTTVYLSLDGVHLKIVSSRQTTVSLTRLRSVRVRPPDPPRRAIALPPSTKDGVGPSVDVEVDPVGNEQDLPALGFGDETTYLELVVECAEALHGRLLSLASGLCSPLGSGGSRRRDEQLA